MYCLRPLSEAAEDPALRPTVDHFIPRSKDGSHRLRNLVLACPSCNNLKADADPADWLACCGLPTTLRTARAVIAYAAAARAPTMPAPTSPAPTKQTLSGPVPTR